MLKRKIEIAWIERALAEPDWSEANASKPDLVHAILRIAEEAPDQGSASARSNQNTEPLPGSLSTRSSLPCARSSLRLMARPRPLPP